MEAENCELLVIAYAPAMTKRHDMTVSAKIPFVDFGSDFRILFKIDFFIKNYKVYLF